MKFFCEYCGSVINTEEDDKCPHCGAAYSKNKTYIKLEEERNKERQLNKEYKHKIIGGTMKALKFSWLIFLAPVFIFIAILIIAIVLTHNTDNDIDSNLNNFNSIIDKSEETKEEQKKVTVNFNEFGEIDDYKVKVIKYEVVEDKFNNLEEGYELVKFHLVVENTSGDKLTKEDVNCIVDGVAQNNDFTSGYSDLPMFIQKDLTVKGTSTFEVPKNATSYDIKYGDYITIHIEK